MKKIVTTITFLAVAIITVSAQNIAPRDNFLWDIDYYNPAVVMKPNGVYTDFYGRYDINKIKNVYVNPLDLSAETYIVRDDHHWQASLAHDGLSYIDAAAFNVAYSHLFVFGKESQHHISIGGRVTLGYGRIDYSKLDYGQEGYKIMVRPDIDLGIEYRYKFFHTGICVKNVLSLPLKDNGMTYFRYPRACIWHMLFDVNIRDKVYLTPFMALGMNQNVFLDLGFGMRFLKVCRFNYSFHGPMLSHNLGLGFDIAKRLHIGAAYCFSPTHNTSGVTVRLSVKIAD